MEQEEKLKKAKRLYETANADQKYVLESIFPELAEVRDEEIRKAIIDFFKHEREEGITVLHYGVNIERMIAWLEKQGNNTPTIIWHNIDEKPKEMEELFCEWESDDAIWHDVAFYDEESHTFRHAKMPINVTKWVYVDELLEKQGEQKPYGQKQECVDCQFNYAGKCKGSCAMKRGEQKPTNKVEPKFHEGEWVVTDKNNVVQIKAIEESKYVLENTMRFSVDYVDKCWRKWTIQDAKAGDVLANNNGWVGFFKVLNSDDFTVYCFITRDMFFNNECSVYDTLDPLFYHIHPATKEQRNTLIKAMADAGYTFDFEKKELKKIEQKPAWSEEDESILQGIWDEILANKHDAKEYEWKTYDRFLDWIKSLKDRYTWKPSDEQMVALKHAFNDGSIAFADMKILATLYEQLKALHHYE